MKDDFEFNVEIPANVNKTIYVRVFPRNETGEFQRILDGSTDKITIKD